MGAINGHDYAFKWYASLGGKSVDELIAYGKSVEHDEWLLRSFGLSPDQVPGSKFYVAKFNNQPELFALQRWVDAPNLREVPIWEIIKNPNIRRSLAELFLNCGNVYPPTGRFPDLASSNIVRVLGRDIVDPSVIFWPFRTTNIKIENEVAVISDAKMINPQMRFFIYQARRVHRLMTLVSARALLLIDDFRSDLV